MSALPAAPPDSRVLVRELIDPVAARVEITRFVQHCGGTALAQRFFLPRPLDPREVLANYRRYLLPDPPHRVALMAFADDMPVGLLNVLTTRPGAAEAAVMVAESWQRRGIGRALTAAALSDGRWAGWTVRVHIQHANVPVRRLLQAAAVVRETVASGVSELEVAIHVPARRTAPAVDGLSTMRTGPMQALRSTVAPQGRVVAGAASRGG